MLTDQPTQHCLLPNAEAWADLLAQLDAGRRDVEWPTAAMVRDHLGHLFTDEDGHPVHADLLLRLPGRLIDLVPALRMAVGR